MRVQLLLPLPLLLVHSVLARVPTGRQPSATRSAHANEQAAVNSHSARL